MRAERDALLADHTLTGTAWCEAYTALIDKWLIELFDNATPATSGVALVAVGGYGRSELCPSSDIDVMLVHDKRVGVGALAERIWYPIWDESLKLGHSVSTVRGALRLASDDLDTATTLLSARHLAGDAELTSELAQRALSQWTSKANRWFAQLAERVDARHDAAGDVSFRLEPDLKEGRGGMRDVHALQWAETARRVLLPHDEGELEPAYQTLLAARVELHRHTRRASNVLTLHDQDAVATALGNEFADVLMGRIATAARTIAWTSDDAWRRVRSSLSGPSGRGAGRGRQIVPGVVLVDDEIRLDDAADATDVDTALRVAIAAATNGAAIDRLTLERLATDVQPPAVPWTSSTRDLFIDLLLAGRPAIAIIEALDHRGVWARLLPEWNDVRARPQRNPYHRFTVDRHLLETVAVAGELRHVVHRGDLLVLAALLHDLGKGSDGDHTEAGVVLAERIGQRMNLDDRDRATVVALVEHHLLLPDTATRRDIDDPVTIDRVASTVVSAERLRLLAALAEADGRATGPLAWSTWKAELVRALVSHVSRRLGSDTRTVIAAEEFPSAEQLARLEAGGQHIDIRGDEITVMTDDRPGVFSRVAGVLALRGLDVVHAIAHSTDSGRAVSRFRVADPHRDETPWDRVLSDLDLVLDGRLALHARLAERADSLQHRQRLRITAPPASVAFDNEAAIDATVIDVNAPDATGILYRITRALAELDLDIRSAKVQTLGTHVVDAFYVCDRHGHKVTDPRTLGEIERAILHGIAEADYSSK